MIQNRDPHTRDRGERSDRAPDTLEAALAGLRDGRWQVRLASLHWLLRTGEGDWLDAAVPLTRDPRRRVRQLAVWAIGRTGGHPDAVLLLLERVHHDESPRVRRMALQMLAFVHAHPDLCGVFQQLLDTERDPKLHRLAGIGLWLCGGGRR